jgi:hypothetical protein
VALCLAYVLKRLRAAVTAAVAAATAVPQCAATTAAATDTAAAWAKLWHFTPCLLLAPDGGTSREERWRLFAAGDWPAVLQPVGLLLLLPSEQLL